jgi:uncharacterized protein YcbK (DUF882 family)
MSEYLNKFKLSPHFNLKEFECPCCQTVKLEPYLINCIQAIRYTLNTKIIISSGYRCSAHNQFVGGVPDSKHLTGQAIDIIILGIASNDLLKLCKDIGFTYGYYNEDKKYYHLQISV